MSIFCPIFRGRRNTQLRVSIKNAYVKKEGNTSHDVKYFK